MRQIKLSRPRDQRIYLHRYNTVTKPARYLNPVPSSSARTHSHIHQDYISVNADRTTCNEISKQNRVTACSPTRASNSFRLLSPSRTLSRFGFSLILGLDLPAWSEDHEGEKENRSQSRLREKKTKSRFLSPLGVQQCMGCPLSTAFIYRFI